MTLLLVFALILVSFYLGVANSMTQSKAGAPLRGMGLMTVAGGLAIGTWQVGQFVFAPSAALTIIFALCFLVLVFLLGLGRLVGSLIARLQVNSKTRSIAVGATMAIPTMLSGLAVYQYESHRKTEELAKTLARDAFQQKTLTANFGDHVVSFPVSPALRIKHSCRNHSRSCVTDWYSKGINSAQADDLVLHSVRFSSLAGMESKFMGWCAKRPDLAKTSWCELSHEYEFSLHVRGQNRIPWGQADGAILFEAPEKIRVLVCSDHWKGLSCRAIIDIAAGIEAHVPSQGLTPSAAGQRALEALPAIKRHWETMLEFK